MPRVQLLLDEVEALLLSKFTKGPIILLPFSHKILVMEGYHCPVILLQIGLFKKVSFQKRFKKGQRVNVSESDTETLYLSQGKLCL